MKTVNNIYLRKKIFNFVKKYIEMDIDGIIINCPYWRNKLKEGKVIVRGYANGKGSSFDIRGKIIETLHNSNIDRVLIDKDYIRKLAKRERIGIDCSGFAYRLLNELVRLGYNNSKLRSLDEVFLGGINKTKASILTDSKFSIRLTKIADYKMGDMIRLMGGKHIAIILEVKKREIIYAHSTNKTKVKGVHLGRIKITDLRRPIQEQNWLEETETGENIAKKYFSSTQGDGVFRLNIFT